MSTKIEYEDGSVYFEPEPSETEDLEYVYLLCDDYENGGYYPYRFFNRMCNGLIKAPFSRLQFMNNDEIVSTLEGYELDAEKFWMAVLLGDDMGDVMIQIRKGRKNLDVHPMIKRDVIDALHAKLEELKRKGADNLFAYRSEDFKADYPVLSYKMYFATERLRELFAALERCRRIGKPKRRKGSLVSYNRMLLFARIVYMYRYTDNPAFLDSDDPLKGIMKDYRGKIPQTLSAIYD